MKACAIIIQSSMSYVFILICLSTLQENGEVETNGLKREFQIFGNICKFLLHNYFAFQSSRLERARATRWSIWLNPPIYNLLCLELDNPCIYIYSILIILLSFIPPHAIRNEHSESSDISITEDPSFCKTAWDLKIIWVLKYSTDKKFKKTKIIKTYIEEKKTNSF